MKTILAAAFAATITVAAGLPAMADRAAAPLREARPGCGQPAPAVGLRQQQLRDAGQGSGGSQPAPAVG
jgi:hypothetical protein